jgi:uncharacterized RmlC-like cupin family protein
MPGWSPDGHHHGEHESATYVLTGALRMEFGPGGTEVLDAGPGDFVYVARRAVHRESNPTGQEAQIVVVRSGSGEPVVNVDGPDATWRSPEKHSSDGRYRSSSAGPQVPDRPPGRR